ATHETVDDECKEPGEELSPLGPKHVPAQIPEATGEFTKIFLRKNTVQPHEVPNHPDAASSSDKSKSQAGPFTMQFPPGFEHKEDYDPQNNAEPEKTSTNPANSTVEFSSKDVDVLPRGHISQLPG